MHRSFAFSAVKLISYFYLRIRGTLVSLIQELHHDVVFEMPVVFHALWIFFLGQGLSIPPSLEMIQMDPNQLTDAFGYLNLIDGSEAASATWKIIKVVKVYGVAGAISQRLFSNCERREKSWSV